MEVYLIRHTTPKVEKGICYGQTDLDITNSFKAESNIVKQELGEFIEDAAIYSSPLIRCVKLAKAIASTPLILDDRLMELNFGDWEMKAWNNIDQTALNHWMDNFVEVACPNGESYQALYKRTTGFIKELKQKGHSKALVFTHGGVIRSLLSYINQTPLDQSFDQKISYCAVFKLVI